MDISEITLINSTLSRKSDKSRLHTIEPEVELDWPSNSSYYTSGRTIQDPCLPIQNWKIRSETGCGGSAPVSNLARYVLHVWDGTTAERPSFDSSGRPSL